MYKRQEENLDKKAANLKRNEDKLERKNKELDKKQEKLDSLYEEQVRELERISGTVSYTHLSSRDTIRFPLNSLMPSRMPSGTPRTVE